MTIVWRQVASDNVAGESTIYYSARIKYQPEAVSRTLRLQLADLRANRVHVRIGFLEIHRTRTSARNRYSVFTKLICLRGPLRLRTAICSEETFSVETALKTAAIAVGSLESRTEPLGLQYDQRQAIEQRAIEISSAGSDIAEYWHQVEVLYESWHNRDLIAVDSLGPSKLRVVVKQFGGEEIQRLLKKHAEPSAFPEMTPKISARRLFAVAGGGKAMRAVAGLRM